MFSARSSCIMESPYGRRDIVDEIMERSLEYIKKYLKADITLADLAREAGYSTWHFSRLFQQATGQPVARYMLARRLEHALREIASGRRAVDVVPAYGFETYSGFYRAFVKLYGCSPKKYLRIYGDHPIKKTEVAMKHYTKTELRQILKHWGMEKAEIGDVPVMYDLRPDDSAWQIGEEYRLRTGDRARCLQELRLTQAMADRGLGAVTPIPTLNGQGYLDDQEIFLLQRIAPGDPLRVGDCYGPQSPARVCGQGIARLHEALRAVAADVPHDRGDLLESAQGWALAAVRKQNEQWGMGLDEDFFASWQEEFARLYPRLPRQLIHRNLCPSYVLLRDGQVAGFTQFDMIEEEARLFDICYAATAILSETADEGLYPAWLNVLEALLRGYDSESPLTDAERQAVYGMLCANQMICVAYFGDREEYREVARRNRAMLTFIAGQRERIGHML